VYKVFLVDDHEFVIGSLTHTLESTGEFAVVGKTTNAANAEVGCAGSKPDLVITDVCTEHGSSGLDAAKKIRKVFPDIKIIVMSGFDEITYLPRAKEIGAHGFIFKHKSLEHFVETAKRVMQGEICFPEPKTIPLPTGEAPLTERELEVLRLMCKGMNNEAIAEELFIATTTVKYHKSNMLGKTGFKKAADLVFYVIDNGWINPKF